MTAGEDRAGRLVPPGEWPGDPASPATPVAGSVAEVASLAAGAPTLAELIARQSVCRACRRLVAWREEVAVVRRRSFRDERYWGRPIPGWGSARPKLLIVGLAPAAHGGNRTGRVFTGDRSGDFLFASLYRCGWAEKPTSVTIDDGQRLIGARMVAAVRCAPPDNKPEPAERDTCAPWLQAELNMIATDLRVIVCLGGFAWQAIWPVLRHSGFTLPRPRPAFGHGAEVRLETPGPQPPRTHPPTQHPQTQYPGSQTHHSPYLQPQNPQTSGEVQLIGCYHPSQQNTFTGRVTPAMLDAIFIRARTLANPETDHPVT